MEQLAELGAGIIVGSTLRKNGVAGAPLDLKRIKDFVAAWKRAGAQKSQKSQASKNKKGKVEKKKSKSNSASNTKKSPLKKGRQLTRAKKR